MVHEDYKEMIPARALSALDAGEDRALSEHLSKCPECRRELDDWLATSASLSLTADAAEPSPQVRERLLAEIHSDKRRVDQLSESSRVLPFPLKRSTWSAASSFGAIAAAILFVALMVGVVVLWRENRATQASLDELRAQLQDVESDLKRKNEIVELVRSPGSHVMDLRGTNMAPGAIGKIAFNSRGHAMLMAEGLPVAPAGKEYQLWFIVGDKPPMPGKSFSTDTSGSGMIQDEVPSEAMNSAVFAITLEPKGGVKAPTGKIYLSSGT